VYPELYTATTPYGGEPLLLTQNQPTVDVGKPTTNEIIQAIKKLRYGRAPGVEGIQTEDLKNSGAIPQALHVF
jgi:hypothetical protein